MKDGQPGKSRKASRNAPVAGGENPSSGVSKTQDRADRLLHDGEEPFLLALEAAQLGIWTADLDVGAIDGSARARALHGLAAEGLVSKADAMAAVHPDHRADLAAALELTMRTGKPSTCVYRTATSQGRQWIESVACLVDDHGTRRLHGIVRDITSNKLAEQTLQASLDSLEQRVAERTAELEAANTALREKTTHLQWVLDASQAGTSKWDARRGPNFEWDARERALFGFGAEEPVTLDAIMARVHPADRAAIYEQMEKEIPPGGHLDWNHEFRILHPVLGVRWIVGRGKLMRDGHDQSLSMAGINFDVTERKEAAEALARKQAQLQAILDHSPALISVKDLKGNVIVANRGFEVLDAPPLHELLGRNVFDLFPKDIARELWDNDLKALKAGGPVQSEERVKHKNGEWHTYLTVKFPLYAEEGEPYGICAISTDITWRKQDEDEIRKLNATLEQRVAERTAELTHSEERFRRLAEASFEGIATSRDGILIDCNEQYAAMFGYEPAEIIGMPAHDLLAPEWREAFNERLRTDSVMRVEFEGLRKDGSVFPLEVRSHLLIENGIKVRVGAVRDLTEIKETEARMRAHKLEIESAQRLSLVSEISVGIIHQISQPLTALIANVTVLSHRLGTCGTTSCNGHEIIRDVEMGASRMRDVVVQLRSLVKGAGADIEEIDLNRLATDVQLIIEPEAMSCEVGIVARLAAGLPRIRGNPVQLSQVVINVLRNAVEACSDSPRKRRMVEIVTRAIDDNNVELCISDNGGGIAPDVASKMFQPFFTTKPEGVGIGLSLSRRIIQAHHGTIGILNNPGKPGATVKIELPIGSKTTG
jgi:hypothetical protein